MNTALSAEELISRVDDESSQHRGSAARAAAFCSGHLSKYLLDATGIQPLAQFGKDHQGSFQALAGRINGSLLEAQMPNDRERLRLSIRIGERLTEYQR